MQRSLPLGPLPAVAWSPCRHRATARRLHAAPARRAVVAAAEAGAAAGATEASAAAAPGGQTMDMHACRRLACSTRAPPHCLAKPWPTVRSPRPGHGARTPGSAPHVLLRIACLSPGPLCALQRPGLGVRTAGCGAATKCGMPRLGVGLQSCWCTALAPAAGTGGGTSACWRMRGSR